MDWKDLMQQQQDLWQGHDQQLQQQKQKVKQQERLARSIFCGWLEVQNNKRQSQRQDKPQEAWSRRFFSVDADGLLSSYVDSTMAKRKGHLKLLDGADQGNGIDAMIRPLDVRFTGRPYCFRVRIGRFSCICHAKDEIQQIKWLRALWLGAGRQNTSPSWQLPEYLLPFLGPISGIEDASFNTPHIAQNYFGQLHLKLRCLLLDSTSEEGYMVVEFGRRFRAQ
jgi:hypothetical protein